MWSLGQEGNWYLYTSNLLPLVLVEGEEGGGSLRIWSPMPPMHAPTHSVRTVAYIEATEVLASMQPTFDL